MEIKLKYKIGFIIFKLFFLLIGIASLILAIGLLNVILSDLFNPLFIGLVIYSIIAYVFLYISLGIFKSYKIVQNSLEVKILFGLLKRNYSFKNLTGYNSIPFQNKLGTYKGILILTGTNEKIYVTEFEFSNYFEFENIITEKIHLNNTIKLKDWFLPLKILLGAPILIIFWYIASQIVR